MSPQNKTPRQVPGLALVSLTALIDPLDKRKLEMVAEDTKQSVGWHVRRALRDYLADFFLRTSPS